MNTILRLSVLPCSFLMFLAVVGCAENSRFDLETAMGLEGVIYEGDSREEVDPAKADEALVKATAMLVRADRLIPSEAGSYSWTLPSLQETHSLCSNEKFLDQKPLGHCSGVLIGKRRVLTAAHCIQQEGRCEQTRFFFGWDLRRASRGEISSSDVYSCKKVVKSLFYLGTGIDYAIVELDRDVEGAVPVPIAKETPYENGTLLKSLSHPLGLPMKKDLGRVIKDDESNYRLTVAVDVFGGSSGSPLFNSAGELVGILSKGEPDILEADRKRQKAEGGCLNFNKCDKDYCFGEVYYKTFELSPWSTL